MKRDIYQEITSRIIESIEQGVAPWKKPWKSRGSYPVNVRTGRRYRGINVLILAMTPYADPRWGTYKAITEAGGQVRKGEHGTHIVLWKPVKKKHVEEGERSEYLLLRDYVVFNAEQADGLPEIEREQEREFTPIEEAQRIADGYVWTPGSDNSGPPVSYGFDQAYYSPFTDKIGMPAPEQFHDDESFYRTLFHELVHSTGHEKRLARLEPAIFGSDPYAREELVAEVGASFLAGMAGIGGEDESASYLAGWLERLNDDRKLIVNAAASAQKAVDLVCGTQFQERQQEQEISAAA